MKHLPIITSFILILTLCASIAYWAMLFFTPAVGPVAVPARTTQTIPTLDAAARLFGGHLNTAITSNFQLIGVIVASNPVESVAILAVDEKPAQAIRFDREVEPGVRLTEVNRRYVVLSEDGVAKRINLPENVIAQVK